MSTDPLAPKYNSRRNFLRTGVTATLATAAYPALGAARVADAPTTPVPAPVAGHFERDFELDEITIDDLQKAFQSGQYSCRSLTEKYLARIQEIDKAGPMLNSVIELNPDALSDRRRARPGAQVERAARTAAWHSGPHQGQYRYRRPHEYDGGIAGAAGIAPSERRFRRRAVAQGRRRDSWAKPILVSGPTFAPAIPPADGAGAADLLATLMLSTAIRVDRVPGLEPLSPRISALLAWARRRTGRSSVPLLRTVWLGLKPTVGLVSRSGIVPISHSQDTAGPMARTVRDVAILLGAMAGADPRRFRDRRQSGQGVSRLHEIPRSQGTQRRAPGSGAQILRLQRCCRPLYGLAARRDEARGRGDRRSRRHSHHWQVRRQRTDRLLLRTQGRPCGVSRSPRQLFGEEFEGCDRVQRAQSRPGNALLRAGHFS